MRPDRSSPLASSRRSSQGAARPFRWDVSRPHALARLDASPAFLDAALLHDLRVCAARVIDAAGDADLVFVGRSPESLFDYLTGVLRGTAWQARLDLLAYSARRWPLRDVRAHFPGAVGALRAQFEAAGLAPDDLRVRTRPVVFVDLVASGETFARLNEFLEDWSRSLDLDPRAWRRRVRFVGIVARGETSPTAWRWQQHAAWRRAYPPSATRSVAVPWSLWDFLGNWQAKVTPSHSPSRWNDDARFEPPRERAHLEASHAASRLVTLGASREERARFARLLAAQPAVRDAWARALARDVREARVVGSSSRRS